jgi:hypothetical protein
MAITIKRAGTELNVLDEDLVNDGVTDNFDEQVALRTYLTEATDTVWRVTYPAGDYDIGETNLNLFSSGIFTPPYRSPFGRFTVTGSGANIMNGKPGAADSVRNDQSCPIAEATAGDYTVTFLDEGAAASIALDINNEPMQYVMVCALNLQLSSLPVNPHYFEFKKIKHLDTIANTLTFTEPLTRSYKTTYPLLTFYESYAAGPATVYPMDPRWNLDLLLQGTEAQKFEFSQIGGISTNISGRSVTVRHCNFSGYGLVPTAADTFVVEDSYLGDNECEVDKLITYLEFTRCTGPYVAIQSTSVYDCLIEDCAFTTLNGTPTNIEINNSVFTTLSVGPTGYGVTDSVVLNGCTMSVIGGNKLTSTIASFTSINNGIFTRPIADGPINGAVEGAHWFVLTADSERFIAPVGVVTDVIQNGSNIEVHTTLADEIPVITGAYLASKVGIIGPNSISFTDCDGCVTAEAMSHANAVGKNLGEYYRVTVDDGVRPPDGGMIGNLVSLKVNVTQAYTGAQSTCLLHPTSEFGAPLITAGADSGWLPKVNLKITGERVFTPGNAMTGGQTGDVDAIFPVDGWLVGSFHPFFVADMSGDDPGELPIVTIEVITDQGF